MSAKDWDKKTFDEGTITKLEIFEAYLKEWLPVFINQSRFGEINICDFFAGAGKDISGNLGSPLRILSVLNEFRGNIFSKGTKINLIFNEKKKQEYEKLKTNVNEEFNRLNFGKLLDIQYYKEDFTDLFLKKANSIKDMPNFIFLDQFGIKQITPDVFNILESFSRTDFMFFIATSYLNRFMDTKEFQKHFPGLDVGGLKDTEYKDFHRFVLEYYRKNLPASSKTRLCPFTIKKGPNIYGLIFGSKNVLGIEKFLKVAWDKNKINGEANFDIDNDIESQQEELFPDTKKKTKIEKFQDDIKEFFLTSKVFTNRQIFDYTLDNGFLSSHASKYIRSLKNEGIIKFNGHAKINYDKCYKKPEEVRFEVIQ